MSRCVRRVRGLDCCHPVNPFAGRVRVCCDFDGTCCAHYFEDSRDCFWPDFTHPTWLPCKILYGCPPLKCPDPSFKEDKPCGNEKKGCGCKH